MKITPKLDFVSGSFDTDTMKIVSVSNKKYGDVELCFQSNMLIGFAEIKLYDSGRAIDADATFEDAEGLGKEIERRWNAFIKPEGEYPDTELVTAIASSCLKHHDSGEASCNKEARVILADLEKLGYTIVKK